MRSRLFYFMLWICALSVGAPLVLQAQQTPVITGTLQSASPNSEIPNHGNAITDYTPINYFYLYVNGSFNSELFDYVEWKNLSTGQTDTLSCEQWCSVFNDKVIVRVPAYLFQLDI